MKTILSILFFALTSLGAAAQKNYFVYIQSETKQPFYVKLNDRTMNSSTTGYIVVPKLTTGNYSLNIGFPNDQWPLQSIPLSVGNADAGYLLKDFGEKGWGLYNIQTMELSMNGATGKQATAKSSDDVFATVLAGAANTTIVSTPKPTEVTIVEVKNPVVIQAEPSKIQKISSIDSPEGLFQTYTDGNDTVRVFIAAPPTVANTAPATDSVKTTTITASTDSVFTGTHTPTVKTEPAKDQKFLDIELQNPNAKPSTDSMRTAEVVTKPAEKKAESKPVVSINSDCRSNAGEEDFLKTRKKMAREIKEDDMVEVATRFLKAKCYTTDQVRNLSYLFLSDEGKYKFFDAAYPHTSDTQNFSTLISELKDAYYINRFKAMVRN